MSHGTVEIHPKASGVMIGHNNLWHRSASRVPTWQK